MGRERGREMRDKDGIQMRSHSLADDKRGAAAAAVIAIMISEVTLSL